MIIAKKSKKKAEKAFWLILGCFFAFLALINIFVFVLRIFDDKYTLIVADIVFSIISLSIFSFSSAFSFYYYTIYLKLPDIVAEFDGHYLYIHGKKETKIHVLDLKDAKACMISSKNPNVYLRLKDKRKYKIPIPNDVCETVNRLQGIIKSIKV